MQVAPPELSSYAESLNQEAKTRYKDKIALIDGIDPFRKATAGEPYSGVRLLKLETWCPILFFKQVL